MTNKIDELKSKLDDEKKLNQQLNLSVLNLQGGSDNSQDKIEVSGAPLIVCRRMVVLCVLSLV